MKESDLTVPARKWLESQGYSVYFEIFGHDMIGLKDSEAIVVELKRGMTSVLDKQLHYAARWADYVVACIPDIRTPVYNCVKHGFGVLLVRPDGSTRLKHKPRRQPWQREKYRAYRLKCLAATIPAAEHHLAGLPSCPRLRQQREELTQHMRAMVTPG